MLVPALMVGILYGFLLIGFPIPSGHFLIWLGILIAAHLIFFSIAVFVTFLTGNPFMHAFFYGFFNFIIITFYGMGYLIAQIFVFGFDATSIRGLPFIVHWLTPAYAILMNISSLAPGAPIAANALASIIFWLVYLVIAGLIAIFGYRLYRRRKIESAGEIILHKPVRSVMIYLVGFLVGALLGYILTSMVNSNRILSLSVYTIWLATSTAFFGSLGCLFANMLIHKQLRVLQTAWKGITIYIAAIIALTLFIRLDMTGFERRVPDADDVVSVSFTAEWRLHYNIYSFDGGESISIQLPGDGWGLSWQYVHHQHMHGQAIITEEIMEEIKLRTPDLFESREAIDVAIRMHEAILSDRSILERTKWNSAWTPYFLTYTMNDGSTITRQYIMPVNEIPMPASVEALLELYNQSEAINKRNRFLTMPDSALLEILVPPYLGSTYIDDNHNIIHPIFGVPSLLVPQEAHSALLDALRKDAEDGTLGYIRQQDLPGNDPYLLSVEPTGVALPPMGSFSIDLVYDFRAVGIPMAFEPDLVFDDFGHDIASGLRLNIIVHEGLVYTMQVLREFDLIP
jgi:hypothetical protein